MIIFYKTPPKTVAALRVLNLDSYSEYLQHNEPLSPPLDLALRNWCSQTIKMPFHLVRVTVKTVAHSFYQRQSADRQPFLRNGLGFD